VSGTETLLYLVGVPFAIVVVVWALAYRGGPGAAKRYRPGRPYQFAPVWYVANHRTGPDSEPPALETDQRRAALPAAEPASEGIAEPGGEEIYKAVGGASDRW
jgi:hypothetical protein